MVVTELQRAALLRAVYSERQLYELMVGFWENHFSIFANKDDDRYLLTSYDRDTIRPFALARFRDLLGATGQWMARLLRFQPNGGFSSEADIAALEEEVNPDGGVPDTDPYAVQAGPGGEVVVDAGGPPR